MQLVKKWTMHFSQTVLRGIGKDGAVQKRYRTGAEGVQKRPFRREGEVMPGEAHPGRVERYLCDLTMMKTVPLVGALRFPPVVT
jgi:hypothetical protein